MNATPTKLRDGSWGARVTGAAQPGDVITITTRAGKSWQARVERVVWRGGGVSICSTASVEARAARRGPRECEECGEIIRHANQRCWETGGPCYSL